MKEQIEQIKENSINEIENAKDLKQLQDLKAKYLGKKGELTQVLRTMGTLAEEERPVIGSLVNEVRGKIENLISRKEEEFKKIELNKKIENERIDITLPSKKMVRGSKHPMNLVIEEVEDLFVSMGYDVVSGPELETDEYCFKKLNLPEGHPARDMQDSFYITNEYLLRTQTSSAQARVMEQKGGKEPIRIICPGKTYRREDDATHSPQFAQVEGLVIDKKDKNVSLADLKGTLEIFAKKMLGENSKLRFRPSYFPFTEPSAEMDISCNICGGKGCPFCKHTGWVEILGCGMVDPNVLESNGIDSKVYSGYALGMGIERITNLKYQVKDLRMFSENDTRFLKEFEAAY